MGEPACFPKEGRAGGFPHTARSALLGCGTSAAGAMVASAIFILDAKGKILISRNYRGDVSRANAEKCVGGLFCAQHLQRGAQGFPSPASAARPHTAPPNPLTCPRPFPAPRFSLRMQESGDEMKPVFAEDGVSYVHVKHNNLYLVALTRKNSNVMVILVFLEKLVQIMNEYFGSLEEESIRDNFVLVYELLDEVMDHGYPQIAEVKVLKEYITLGAHKLAIAKAPQAVTNVVSWRTEGIRHKKNEVFLDVVEKLNLLVAANGTVLSSEILGSIKMRSFLSGMPELKLGLNDKALFEAQGRAGSKKAVEMEDIKFHQCVRLTRFETDRTISFIPPDGEFELMSYRLNTSIKPLITLETLVETHGRSRVDYIVKAKSTFKNRSYANNVDILIPVPPDVDSPAFTASTGVVTYVPDLECIKWSIRQLPGGKDISMRATFGLPSVAGEEVETAKWRKRTAQVKFEIPYFSVSGIQVRYLKILEKSGYEALPWVCVLRGRRRWGGGEGGARAGAGRWGSPSFPLTCSCALPTRSTTALTPAPPPPRACPLFPHAQAVHYAERPSERI